MVPRLRLVGAIAVLGATYFEAATFGLKLAYVHASATAVWAPTGIALAALLMFGTRLWPGVFLGALLVNVTTPGNLATACFVAAGNTLEALLGAILVQRYANGRTFLYDPRSFFRFVLLAALGSTVIGATTGLSALTALGFATPESFGEIWLTWWLGDAAGTLIFAPLIVSWVDDPRVRWNRREAVEPLLVLGFVVGVSELVFGGWAPDPFGHFPFLMAPLLLWPAFRFGPRLTATSVLVTFLVALVRTLDGSGPYATPVPFAELLALQIFLAVLAVTSMAVAAANSARCRATADLVQTQRELQGAIAMLAAECKHDALTGVANRRGFAERLRAEAERSRRRREPLAMLVVDIDRFRRHNQEMGHAAADQILRSVAVVLKAQLRACDHLARFGGDEFVILLPATEVAGARVTAERCRRAIADADWGARRVTVSIGVTSFEVETMHQSDILAIADQALFRAKAAGRNRVASLSVRTKPAAAAEGAAAR
jgi:diguanylate cyclase (GGDEF)-like protein